MIFSRWDFPIRTNVTVQFLIFSLPTYMCQIFVTTCKNVGSILTSSFLTTLFSFKTSHQVRGALLRYYEKTKMTRIEISLLDERLTEAQKSWMMLVRSANSILSTARAATLLPASLKKCRLGGVEVLSFE